MTSASTALRVFALGVYGVLLFATAPPWPDDWDGVGFVEAVHDFDIARFRPHAPGYPVYVALLRTAAAVAAPPMRACVVVAACCGMLAVGLLWEAARRLAGTRAAWLVAALVGTMPAVWRAASGVGSESPALACVAACSLGLVVARRRPRAGAAVLGAGAGLGLGVRLSWAPVFLAALALAPRGARGRAWLTAGVGCAAWAAPLVAVVGGRPLAVLYERQWAGHAARWGGGVATEPGPIRLVWLARDVFVDGFGAGADALGLTIAAVGSLAVLHAIWSCRRASRRGWRAALLLGAPYLLWIGVGQNLRDQPRHALPIVAMLAAGLALTAAPSRLGTVFVGALALAAATRTALDSNARRTIPPPGEQLVELVRGQPSRRRLLVMGTASVRFFELSELAAQARVAASLGDVRMELTRVDELPAGVWVTSELAGLDGPGWPLVPVATLCRPPRIDRRLPCLDVYAWELPFLPKGQVEEPP